MFQHGNGLDRKLARMSLIHESAPILVIDAGIRDDQAAQPEEKRGREELERERGKSLLPISRVQKIIKADKDIPVVAKEATLLISIATEEFIKRITEATYRMTEREKRATVQQRDIATLVRRADEFVFLDEIIGWPITGPPPKRKPAKGAPERDSDVGPTMLDQYVMKNDGETIELVEGQDVAGVTFAKVQK